MTGRSAAAASLQPEPEELVEPPRPYMPTKAATEDWCTPPELVEAVRHVLEEITLDPASNPHSHVGARLEVWEPKWTAPELEAALLEERQVVVGDGLQDVPWSGHVYVNPPYGKALDGFMDRARRAALGEEAGTVLMLAPAKTSRRCWQRTVPDAAAVCFLEGRVRYVLPGGRRESATFSSALVLWTRDRELVHRFAWYLDRKVGHVVFPR